MIASRLASAVIAALVVGSLASAQVETVRSSVDSSGIEGNDSSGADWNDGQMGAVISADGHVVAFASRASNLVSGDMNGMWDVFVHDMVSGLTERISVDSSGAEADGDSSWPALSSDGVIVTFTSSATNLIGNDTNGSGDVFVHDRSTGLTELVSMDSNGVQGNHWSDSPSMSTDGQIIAFSSSSSNLVASDTNGVIDIFVRNRSTGVTERVSVDSTGTESDGESRFPAVSADGLIVSFASAATNLVVGDSNGVDDVFTGDLATGITDRVSVDSTGTQGNSNSGWSGPSPLSSNGQVVAFASDASNLVAGDTNKKRDIFVRDRAGGTTEIVSVNSLGVEGNGNSDLPAVSADGQNVAFESDASRLVAGDGNGCRDVFVHHRQGGFTERVSVDSSGAESSWLSIQSSMSADGYLVMFENPGSDLIIGDNNGAWDVFANGCTTDASWSNYGNGWPGSNGIPGFTSRSNPVLGTTITLDLGNSSSNPTVGLVFLGYQRTSIHSNWGGDLLVVPAITIPITLSYGGDTFTGRIWNDPSLCGSAIDLQAVEADSGASKGVSFTAGLELVLGR
jgi:hypothetical protein